MGDVAVLLRVMPEGPDTDLAALKDAIRDAITVEDMAEEDVAFGLKAVKVSTLVADDAGGTDAVENAVRTLQGVQSVEIEDMNRL